MIIDSVKAIAAIHPLALAIRFEDTAYTYEALLREVAKTSQALRDVGVTTASTVAVFCENSSNIMLLYYAVAMIGGTFVPLNASLSSSEVGYILGHAEANLLFTDSKLANKAQEAIVGKSCILYDVSRFFSANVQAAEWSEEQATQVNKQFLIIYTSGSTGLPKAVLFDQEAEVAGNQSLIDMWAITSKDKMLVALPLGFLYGLSTASATAIQAGCELVILRKFRPGDVLEAIVKHKITIFQGVPTMFAMMLEYAEENSLDYDLSSVRLLISAGAPLAGELRARFTLRFKAHIEDYYALTEVRPVFGKYASDSSPIPAGAIGKACPGAEILIVDTAGNQVSAGTTGEILVRAPSTTTGYLKASLTTQQAFSGKYFRTGDLGYQDSEGFYYITGRIKDIIIRGGANIAPAEVEAALQAHPAVQLSAIIGVPDSKFGELPVAYYVLRTGQTVCDEELTEHCKALLADFKVPAHFVRIAEMPLGNTGKVDKKAILNIWKELHNG